MAKAKAKNYTINGNIVYAYLSSLSATELKEIKALKALDYEIIPVEKPKKTKEQVEAAKAEKAAEKAANGYSKQNVEAFLKKEGNEDLYKEYQKRYNEQAGTNRTKGGVKIADEPKFLKDGTPKVKGFANCIGWFTSMFEYDPAKKEYTKIK